MIPERPFAPDAGMTTPGEEITSRAGDPLPADKQAAASEDAVIDALKTVYDPEIPINLYDLGLIYHLDLRDNGDVAITMTLTTPACPVAQQMPDQVAQTVASLPEVGVVTVELVWDPPWTFDKMSPDARMALDVMM